MTPSLTSDFDPNVWLLLPPGVDPEGWAREQADLAWSEVAGGAPEQGVERLADQLRQIAEIVQRIGVDAAFVHLPRPADGSGFTVGVQIAAFTDGSREALLVEAVRGTGQSVNDPVTSDFDGGRLGTGIRVQHSVLDSDGAVQDSLCFLFHDLQLGVDVKVSCASPFLEEFLDAELQIEALVRGLELFDADAR